jgi:hypothetical protein
MHYGFMICVDRQKVPALYLNNESTNYNEKIRIPDFAFAPLRIRK